MGYEDIQFGFSNDNFPYNSVNYSANNFSEKFDYHIRVIFELFHFLY